MRYKRNSECIHSGLILSLEIFEKIFEHLTSNSWLVNVFDVCWAIKCMWVTLPCCISCTVQHVPNLRHFLFAHHASKFNFGPTYSVHTDQVGQSRSPSHLAVGNYISPYLNCDAKQVAGNSFWLVNGLKPIKLKLSIPSVNQILWITLMRAFRPMLCCKGTCRVTA